MSLRKTLLGATAAALALAGVAGGVPFLAPQVPAAMASEAPQSFADVVEKASPSVVTIMTKMELTENGPSAPLMPDLPDGSPFKDFFDQFKNMPNGQPQHREGRALGSGFIIDPDGLIVTNNHVIDKATEIKAVLSNGEEYPAELVGRDPKTDLALLRIKPKEHLQALQWADSDRARIGDWVIAIGNPFGVGTSVTAGIISARGRDIHAGPYDDFIQVDAAINRGNSGGPLFDADGGVIGVNTAILSPSGGNIGLGFAIPSNQAKTIIAQLEDKGSVERGWIGVSIQPVTPDLAEGLALKEAKGALVAQVVPNSPAEKAGLRQGDVILDFAGKPVNDLRDLTRMVAASDIGKDQSLTVWRQGHEKTLEVAPARMEQTAAAMPGEQMQSNPAVADLPDLGLTLGQADQGMSGGAGDEQKSGVLVTGVEPGKPAADSGLRPGDVILSIDQEPVKDAAGVERMIKTAEEGKKKSVLLLVEHQGQQHFLALPLSA
jgi:serine protease Do